MIRSRKELKFYIAADRMMNRGSFKLTFKQRIMNLVFPDYIMSYLIAMRKCEYYSHKGLLFTPPLLLNKLTYNRLGLKLGFSIYHGVFGYGLVIPHYGTIVVGANNRIGNYAVLHSSTCITGNGKVIGDALYLATGAKITSPITLGDNISIGANSVVNKSFESDVMIAGMPATIKKTVGPWYVRDGENYSSKVKQIEALKAKLKL